MNEIRIAPTVCRLGHWVPAAVATRLYILMLGLAGLTAFRGARRPRDIAYGQMEYAERLLRRLRQGMKGVTAPGDEQAMSRYKAGVAFGFFGLAGQAPDADTVPVSGSVWRQSQLCRLREIGLRHGSIVRDLSLAAARSHHAK